MKFNAGYTLVHFSEELNAMYVSVAKRLVSVALIAIAAPALAASGSASTEVVPASFASEDHGTTVGLQNYWTASSEYLVSERTGVVPTNADAKRPVRRVMITGYHPIEGFASEIAKEAENAAR